jgi:signal transduction histidine kinase
LLTLAYPLLLLLIPVSVGIAILRYHLWDIDILIKRTLVYGLLTAFVIGMYVLIVGYLGAIFRAEGNLAISLIATGVVAVLFQPLRDRLQRGVNRLIFGLRDEPYVVLAGLGQRVKTTLDPDAVLPTIVATVREALKLSYAAIEVLDGSQVVLAAAAGDPRATDPLRLPLTHQGEPIGTLVIAARGRSDALAPADVRLLQDLANQIGTAVHTVRLTSDLRALTHDLQRSREHLITAREEERRRLRRDLHDGLGPMLSAIMLKVGLLRSRYQHDPETTETLLTQLEAEIELVIGDIRRLVYNLRPPALDELGLVGAIREYIARLGGQASANPAALTVTLELAEPLPPLPAAVEVAAYRIVQEALTNVIRHAHAHVCQVRFLVDALLQIDVADDGDGLDAANRAGVGLTAMRERAEELGGTFTIRNKAPCGTLLTARLPLADVGHVGEQR